MTDGAPRSLRGLPQEPRQGVRRSRSSATRQHHLHGTAYGSRTDDASLERTKDRERQQGHDDGELQRLPRRVQQDIGRQG